MTKYGRLTDYLATRNEVSFVLTFAGVREIVDLPPSAEKERAWWANSRKSRPHAAASLDAGYNATSDFNSRTVRFERGPDRSRP